MLRIKGSGEHTPCTCKTYIHVQLMDDFERSVLSIRRTTVHSRIDSTRENTFMLCSINKWCCGAMQNNYVYTSSIYFERCEL